MGSSGKAGHYQKGNIELRTDICFDWEPIKDLKTSLSRSGPQFLVPHQCLGQINPAIYWILGWVSVE